MLVVILNPTGVTLALATVLEVPCAEVIAKVGKLTTSFSKIITEPMAEVDPSPVTVTLASASTLGAPKLEGTT